MIQNSRGSLPTSKLATPLRGKKKEGSTSSRTSANVHLYHGFGANLWSWRDVHQPLADYFKGTVSAHDQAGFGLTVRPDEAEEYALFLAAPMSSRVTVAVLCFCIP